MTVGLSLPGIEDSQLLAWFFFFNCETVSSMCHGMPLYLSSVKRHHLHMSHSSPITGRVCSGHCAGNYLRWCFPVNSLLPWADKQTWVREIHLVEDQSVSPWITCSSSSWNTDCGVERARRKKPAVSNTCSWWIHWCWLPALIQEMDTGKKMQVKEEDRFECYLENSGNQLTVNWRDAERMAQVLVMRHVAPFAFIKMVLYLPCPTQE